MQWKIVRREGVCVDCEFARNKYRGCGTYMRCVSPDNTYKAKRTKGYHLYGAKLEALIQPYCVRMNSKGECKFWKPRFSWLDRLWIKIYVAAVGGKKKGT